MDLLVTVFPILLLLAVLGSGLWIGLALLGVAVVAMGFFTQRPVGDSMMLTIWGSTSSWTLTALPLSLWMGEILFRTRLSKSMFRGLAPRSNGLPGRLLHTSVIGCAIFAAVSGSSAATCATIGKLTLPELKRRGHPDGMAVRTLAGAGTLGLLIPPSIIMIVYGVAANVSIAKLFIAGVLPGILLALVFMGYIAVWALRHPEQVPTGDAPLPLAARLRDSRHLIPVVTLIAVVLGSIYTGMATATEAAALGAAGSLGLAAVEGSMNWKALPEGVAAATRAYCMIGLILAGAAFLTLAMGFIGLPRHLAEFIGGLNLSPFALMLMLVAFFVVLVVELAQITPLVGFNLFVPQGLTRRDSSWIAGRSMPLFLLMLGFVLLLWFVPGIATRMPSRMQRPTRGDTKLSRTMLQVSAGALLTSKARAASTWRLATGYRAESFHGQNLQAWAHQIPAAVREGRAEMGEVIMTELAKAAPCRWTLRWSTSAARWPKSASTR